jgi:hypothetical protein
MTADDLAQHSVPTNAATNDSTPPLTTTVEQAQGGSNGDKNMDLDADESESSDDSEEEDAKMKDGSGMKGKPKASVKMKKPDRDFQAGMDTKKRRKDRSAHSTKLRRNERAGLISRKINKNRPSKAAKADSAPKKVTPTKQNKNNQTKSKTGSADKPTRTKRKPPVPRNRSVKTSPQLNVVQDRSTKASPGLDLTNIWAIWDVMPPSARQCLKDNAPHVHRRLTNSASKWRTEGQVKKDGQTMAKVMGMNDWSKEKMKRKSTRSKKKGPPTQTRSN